MAHDIQTGSDGTEGYPFPLDHRRYSGRLRAYLPSTNAALTSAVDDCMRVAEVCGFDDDARTDLEIALREAVANAIIHGNARADGSSFFVRCYAGSDSGLLVLVRDEGGGFNPEAIPDPREGERIHLPRGRGLFLMRKLMDFVDWRRGGSEIVLYKRCAE